MITIKGDDGKCAWCPKCNEKTTKSIWIGFAACAKCRTELVLRSRLYVDKSDQFNKTQLTIQIFD